MTDTVLFNGKDVVILNSNGRNYKKEVARSGRIFIFKTLLVGLLMALVAYAGWSFYETGFTRSPANLLKFLFVIFGGLGSVILCYLLTCSYETWIESESQYNLAQGRNQAAIFKAKEDYHQHQTTMQKISYDKEVTFETSFVKNG